MAHSIDHCEAYFATMSVIDDCALWEHNQQSVVGDSCTLGTQPLLLHVHSNRASVLV